VLNSELRSPEIWLTAPEIVFSARRGLPLRVRQKADLRTITIGCLAGALEVLPGATPCPHLSCIQRTCARCAMNRQLCFRLGYASSRARSEQLPIWKASCFRQITKSIVDDSRAIS
jgi:hypothetical protein